MPKLPQSTNDSDNQVRLEFDLSGFTGKGIEGTQGIEGTLRSLMAAVAAALIGYKIAEQIRSPLSITAVVVVCVLGIVAWTMIAALAAHLDRRMWERHPQTLERQIAALTARLDRIHKRHPQTLERQIVRDRAGQVATFSLPSTDDAGIPAAVVVLTGTMDQASIAALVAAVEDAKSAGGHAFGFDVSRPGFHDLSE